MVDIYTRLSENHQPEQPLEKRKNISVQEKGIHYKAEVNPERNTVVFQVDGDIIKDGRKCDKLILSEDLNKDNSWFTHFIELKGHDIKHAITQIEATLANELFRNDLSITKKFARIVATSFPSSKANPEIERLRTKLKRQFNCELKTLKTNQIDKI